jgi:hypothetical protein
MGFHTFWSRLVNNNDSPEKDLRLRGYLNGAFPEQVLTHPFAEQGA